MVAPSIGEVILVPFPFSDLSATKVRPAVCVAVVGRKDWILCQVTSKPYGDSGAIALSPLEFSSGGLLIASFARPGKLFTANEALMIRSLGKLKAVAMQRILDAIVLLLRPLS